jgi:hypothetical protein
MKMRNRVNASREIIASHHGRSTTGNKMIRIHAHQGRRAHRDFQGSGSSSMCEAYVGIVDRSTQPADALLTRVT